MPKATSKPQALTAPIETVVKSAKVDHNAKTITFRSTKGLVAEVEFRDYDEWGLATFPDGVEIDFHILHDESLYVYAYGSFENDKGILEVDCFNDVQLTPEESGVGIYD